MPMAVPPFFFMEIQTLGSEPISPLILMETVHSIPNVVSYIFSLSSNPLFSTIVTLFAITLLYFPKFLFPIIFSPVPIFTAALLILILQLGAAQRVQNQPNSPETEDSNSNPIEHGDSQSKPENSKPVDLKLDSKLSIEIICRPNLDFSDCFEKWNVKAPLEIIYEDEDCEGEGQDYDDEGVFNENEDAWVGSLSRFHPESDSDSSSDGEIPGAGRWELVEDNVFSFRWDEDEEKEGLIEIPLEGKGDSEFQVEEENLIEIDIC